jgi:hypothetical protein
MKSLVNRYWLCCLLFLVGGQAGAQDPRVGLKAGFKDAGVAARNIELIKNLPKPEGFFQSTAPFGKPEGPPPPDRPATVPFAPAPQTPEEIAKSNTLDFTDSDLVLQFKSHYKMPAAQTEQENCVGPPIRRSPPHTSISLRATRRFPLTAARLWRQR